LKEQIIQLIEAKKELYLKDRKKTDSVDQACFSLLNTLLWEIDHLK
jgi:hypothetical protein